MALSSTAIVLGLLAERDETDTPTGNLSLAILIFQDLAVVVMVLLVPFLAGGGRHSKWGCLGAWQGPAVDRCGASACTPGGFPGCWSTSRIRVGRSCFCLTVVAICLGTAAVSSYAGVSLPLGAFLAELVVSESRYSDQTMSEILPLRTIFNAAFFVSVGMLLNLGILVENHLLVLTEAGVVLIVKFLTTTGSALVLGYPIRIAAAAGLALAQIGEYSFVLERAERASGLSTAGLGEAGAQIFIAATVLLMLVTPLQVQVALI